MGDPRVIKIYFRDSRDGSIGSRSYELSDPPYGVDVLLDGSIEFKVWAMRDGYFAAPVADHERFVAVLDEEDWRSIAESSPQLAEHMTNGISDGGIFRWPPSIAAKPVGILHDFVVATEGAA